MSTPPDPNNLQEGKIVFERFTLKRKLGQGGMGVVWLAVDSLLDQPVALKFLPNFLLDDPAAYDLLRKEAQKALQITHPNIVRVHDFQRGPLMAAISMEYVEGTTLSGMMHDRPDGIFDPGDIKKHVIQLCDALTYAHEKVKIAHRDLKPSNLMIDKQGDLKVTDFGISAPIADSASRFTNALRSSGTLVYMSPQQLMGMPPQPSDDIYAFGATLYELLTGYPPFYAGDVASQVLRRTPPSIRARREELGIQRAPIAGVWETVIASCLAKEAPERPASMKDIANRLSHAQPVAPVAPVPQADAASAAAAPPAYVFKRPDPPVFEPEPMSTRTKLWLGFIVALLLSGSVSRCIFSDKAQPPAPAKVAKSAPVEQAPAPIEKAPPPAERAPAPVAKPEPVAPVTTKAEPPPESRDPYALALEISADVVFQTEGEGLVLIDRAAGEVALWQSSQPQALTRVTLRGNPVCEAWSADLKRLFLGYEDGNITFVDTSPANGAAPVETKFARHPQAPLTLLCAGRLLVVQEATDGSFAAHQLYAADGRKLAKRTRAIQSLSWVWNSRQQRLFFVAYALSPSDLHFEDILPNGTFGKTGDSPYHDSTGIVGNVQLMDKDTSVVLGSGRAYKTTTLELELTLPVPVLALRTLDKKIYIMEETRAKATSGWIDYTKPMTSAVVCRLSSDYDIEATLRLVGQPVGFGVWPRGVVVATRQKKRTVLYWCDPALVVQPWGTPAAK